MVAPAAVVAEQRTPTESAVAPSATITPIRPVTDEEDQKIFRERVALTQAGHRGDIVRGQ